MEGIRSKLDKVVDTFSQVWQDIKNNLQDWDKMKELKLDTLVEIGIIPNREIFLEVKEMMMHKVNIIEDLIDDLQSA